MSEIIYFLSWVKILYFRSEEVRISQKSHLFCFPDFLWFYSASLFQERSASKHAKYILHGVSNVDRPAKVNLTLHEPRQIDYYIVILILPKRLQFIYAVCCQWFLLENILFSLVKWTSFYRN